MSSLGPDRPYRLGFIGLGIMGVPMARRLAERGWQVTAWYLEPERFEYRRYVEAGNGDEDSASVARVYGGDKGMW